jgi:hypothetical protein
MNRQETNKIYNDADIENLLAIKELTIKISNTLDSIAKNPPEILKSQLKELDNLLDHATGSVKDML